MGTAASSGGQGGQGRLAQLSWALLHHRVGKAVKVVFVFWLLIVVDRHYTEKPKYEYGLDHLAHTMMRTREYMSDNDVFKAYMSDNDVVEEYMSDNVVFEAYMNDNDVVEAYISDNDVVEAYMSDNNVVEEYIRFQGVYEL